MGVFSVFKRFILLLYSLTLTFVVLINVISFSGLDLWSGGPLSTLTHSNTFENSYFGFQSIINAFDDFNDLQLVPQFMKILSALNGALSGGAVSLANALSGIQRLIFNGFNGDIFGVLVDFFTGILEIIVAPIEITLALIAIFLWLVNFYYYLVFWVAKVLGGYYNLPVITTPVAPYVPTSYYWSTSTYFNG